MIIHAFIPGVPVAKGSAKAFVIRGTNRAVVTQTNTAKQRPWASIIGLTVQQEMAKHGYTPTGEAVKLGMKFFFQRPKSHMKKDGTLTKGARRDHTSKPDLDKLARCVLDALTSIVYYDDSQVVGFKETEKAYGTQPGLELTVETYDDNAASVGQRKGEQ